MKERSHFEEVGLDERVSKWTFNKFDGIAWTGLI